MKAFYSFGNSQKNFCAWVSSCLYNNFSGFFSKAAVNFICIVLFPTNKNQWKISFGLDGVWCGKIFRKNTCLINLFLGLLEKPKYQIVFPLPNIVEAPMEALTAKKMKFSIKDFLSKCYQIRRKPRIWSHLLTTLTTLIYLFNQGVLDFVLKMC